MMLQHPQPSVRKSHATTYRPSTMEFETMERLANKVSQKLTACGGKLRVI